MAKVGAARSPFATSAGGLSTEASPLLWCNMVRYFLPSELDAAAHGLVVSNALA